jgi:drug/metabolite transporter (DMT)-like permease
MPGAVLMIVLFAALLHASWNFLVKRTENKFVSMCAVVLGHTIFALIAILFSPSPSPLSLPYLFAGALLHVGYQFFLLTSYRLGDLSHVYPLARGVAPVLVATVSVLFLHIRLTPFELLAILIIAAGITSLSLVRRKDGLQNSRAVFYSLITGGFIAAYSMVDGIGARAAGTALGFYGWLSIVNAVVFAVIMRLKHPGVIGRVIIYNRKLALFGGGASFFAYAMVIWAFTHAPIALVTAVRETSIVFAMLFGVVFLRENINLTKLLATALTLLGMVLLRLKM